MTLQIIELVFKIGKNLFVQLRVDQSFKTVLSENKVFLNG